MGGLVEGGVEIAAGIARGGKMGGSSGEDRQQNTTSDF